MRYVIESHPCKWSMNGHTTIDLCLVLVKGFYPLEIWVEGSSIWIVFTWWKYRGGKDVYELCEFFELSVCVPTLDSTVCRSLLISCSFTWWILCSFFWLTLLFRGVRNQLKTSPGPLLLLTKPFLVIVLWEILSVGS